MRLKPELIANRYKIKNVTYGGMSVIYLCEDQDQNDELVVLKTLRLEYSSDKKLIAQFLRESVIWVEMGWHPNIVRAHNVVYDHDQHRIYLVLEFVAGLPGAETPTLRAQLTPGVGVGVEKTLKVLIEITRGMKFATQQIPGLIHCDIKPENIFIGLDGTARVGDFGLALLPTNQYTHINSTNQEYIQARSGPAGTPYYMSPEQWRNRRVSISSDIYSLGCIGYEMITGAYPIHGRHFRTIAEAHIRGGATKRVLEVTLPFELKSFLSMCLDTDASCRFQSWGQVEQMLIQCYEAILHQKVSQENNLFDISVNTQIEKGRAILSIGEASLDMKAYQIAIKCFEKARAIGKSQNQLQLIVRSEANIGMVYYLMNRQEQAYFHYKKAYDQVEDFDPPDYGIIIENRHIEKPL